MSNGSSTIATRAGAVRERIHAAEARAGRPVGSVALCAVSKTFPAGLVAEAIAAGLTEIGENRVQEAESKRPEVEALGAVARWHLIGHLQKNKARRAVELFDVIETIDSLKLADRLDRIAEELDRRIEVYVQVDLGHEETKSGAVEAEVPAILERLGESDRLVLAGLMTVPPYFEDPEEVRPYFRRLRELRDEYRRRGLVPDLSGLSMGMSHDFEVAVEEGATLVRVGSAIFGAR